MAAPAELNQRIEPDIDAAVIVLKNAGTWMRDSGHKNYSRLWNPDTISTTSLKLNGIQPETFYTLFRGGQPAAAMIMRREVLPYRWSKAPQPITVGPSLHLYTLAVAREFAGLGLPGELFVHADAIAREQRLTKLRLEAEIDIPQLAELYTGHRFEERGVVHDSQHSRMLYERPVAPLQA